MSWRWKQSRITWSWYWLLRIFQCGLDVLCWIAGFGPSRGEKCSKVWGDRDLQSGSALRFATEEQECPQENGQEVPRGTCNHKIYCGVWRSWGDVRCFGFEWSRWCWRWKHANLYTSTAKRRSGALPLSSARVRWFTTSGRETGLESRSVERILMGEGGSRCWRELRFQRALWGSGCRSGDGLRTWRGHRTDRKPQGGRWQGHTLTIGVIVSFRLFLNRNTFGNRFTLWE